MLEKGNKSLTRANYKVPKGEENYVHYTIEYLMRDRTTGRKISNPQLIKSGLKQFSKVKKNLELQGLSVNILYHPLGEYNIERTQESEVERLERIVREQQEELDRLKGEPESSEEAESPQPEEVPAPEKKVKGRPKKGE